MHKSVKLVEIGTWVSLSVRITAKSACHGVVLIGITILATVAPLASTGRTDMINQGGLPAPSRPPQR